MNRSKTMNLVGRSVYAAYAATILTLLSFHACHASPPKRAAAVPEVRRESLFTILSYSSVFVRTLVAKVPETGKPGAALGSGTVVGVLDGNRDAILTAAHLLPKGNFVAVYVSPTNDPNNPERAVEAQVAKVDYAKDLALLVTVEKVKGVFPIGLATAEPRVFETVYTMSNPVRAPRTAGVAIVDAAERRNTGKVNVYRLSGFGWPGSSGGTVANDRAELVGVLVGVHTSSDRFHPGSEVIIPDITFAISLPEIVAFVGDVSSNPPVPILPDVPDGGVL